MVSEMPIVGCCMFCYILPGGDDNCEWMADDTNMMVYDIIPQLESVNM